MGAFGRWESPGLFFRESPHYLFEHEVTIMLKGDNLLDSLFGRNIVFVKMGHRDIGEIRYNLSVFPRSFFRNPLGFSFFESGIVDLQIAAAEYISDVFNLCQRITPSSRVSA